MKFLLRCIGGYRYQELENISDYPKTGWAEIGANIWLCPYHSKQLVSIMPSANGTEIRWKDDTQTCYDERHNIEARLMEIKT